MQTVLGAGGQIATELARELASAYSIELRLVSRNPRKVNETDSVAKADLLDAAQTTAAVAGSDVVYFTAGLPANTAAWEAQFPTMLRNALDAARHADAAFAYFDNTYMYPQDDRVQTEDTSFAPIGPKGRVRGEMASMVLEEMSRGDIPALIARAPEFYGPGRTQSFTNALILERLQAGKRPLVPVRDDARRTLIWTPDASRGLALLGNTPDAYGQTWHLPVAAEHPTYRRFVTAAAEAFGREPGYTVLPKWVLGAAAVVSPLVREMRELLPRYQHDNLFDSTKFATRFPDFAVTGHHDGLEIIARSR
ncbi:NAD-dependent epimerase/dehydratase family protein [Humibacter ginsenosidimutans]|uniref:NAD-dependent epimerase/dehydratase family protein n=1 Tax=Humibacter ginsenosidimutans TaxID=2599293 RepID=A0A5B8M1U5_9MICO|nr:NAD-dependent epimerase/dehydratase family protein [Humibacter ginsenosidimutans]QDZ14728.1 NAD-dependent epimerase/dehydratase family protein [Humibacter ginsenosidimutans]